MLEEAISSVRGQSVGDWELCLVDDGSSDPEVVKTLRRHAGDDARIRLVHREQAGGISTATNAALELASGEYIALLDHDDMLAPRALELVARELRADPGLDMIYSDEDVIVDGRRGLVRLKPDWSPETICTMMYSCHLGVYRRSTALQIGGFRPEFDGAQDYDFVLRLIERTDRVGHIPYVLYHWRAHRGSAAGGDAKPYAYVLQARAIAQHLNRIGKAAGVQFGASPGLHRVVHKVDQSLSASLVLPIGADGRLGEAVTRAAASWLKQSHPAWEIVLAASAQVLPSTADALRAAGVEESRIVRVATDASADAAAALNAAAKAARADQLVLMQSPVIGLTHDWLCRLLGYSSEPEIAAAGPIVLSPDGRIKEAGVAIADGTPLFLRHGLDGGWGDRAASNVSAVSGVLATRREAFEHLGELRTEMGDLAPIDYCLRAIQAGMRVVSVPDARLQAVGTDETSNDLTCLERFRQAWRRALPRDPYYNPNYRQDRGDFAEIGDAV